MQNSHVLRDQLLMLRGQVGVRLPWLCLSLLLIGKTATAIGRMSTLIFHHGTASWSGTSPIALRTITHLR
jgi:hypothetical protein